MDSSNRSLQYLDPWLLSAYWFTFAMSFMGIPLVISWWKPGLIAETYVVMATQIAFVGAVAYPLTTFIMWRRGMWFSPEEWRRAHGSIILAVVFGVWLGEHLLTWWMLTTAILAAALVTLIAAARVIWQAR